MQEPDCVDIEVFVGVDIAKGDHYACVVTAAGAEVLARSVRNDEALIGRLIDDAAVHGTVALVIDTTSSAASLLLEAAARREVPVAYVTGLAMRRAADLYAGAAKTDPKDAAVLADYARRNADRLSWTTPSDELLVRLRILNARDADLAADATRAANRLRDALLTVSPALERAVGDKLSSSGGARDALPAGAPPQRSETPARPECGPASPNARPAQPNGSPTPSGARWTRRASPSQPRQPGATPLRWDPDLSPRDVSPSRAPRPSFGQPQTPSMQRIMPGQRTRPHFRAPTGSDRILGRSEHATGSCSGEPGEPTGGVPSLRPASSAESPPRQRGAPSGHSFAGWPHKHPACEWARDLECAEALT